MVKDLLWLTVMFLLALLGFTHTAAFLLGMWWVGFRDGFMAEWRKVAGR